MLTARGTASETPQPDSDTSQAERAPAAVPPPAYRRRGRVMLLVGTGAALLSIGGLIGATFVKSPEQLRAETDGPPPSVLTSTVARRVLETTVVTRGMVESARRVEFTPVAAHGAAVVVVTAVRVTRGDSVSAGDVALSVSGRPLIVLPGAVPGYRDLLPNSDGDDVAQLQKALRQLALYHGGDRSGHFGSSTKAAVRALYERVGFSVPQAGADATGATTDALRAADDAVAAAQVAVELIEARIAADPGATTPPGSLSPQQELAAARKSLKRAEQDRASLIARTGPMAPFSEMVFLPSLPAVVTKLTAKIGDPVEPPLIAFATGALRVVAHMQPDVASVVRPGMKVDITSELLGQSVEGVLTEVGAPTIETGQDGASGAPFVPVAIAPSEPLPSEWNGLDVRLTITAAQTDGEVLVVPLSAVSAGADRRTTVTVVGPDGQQSLVDVRAGVSGDGFVEVTPIAGGLSPGDQVVVGQ